MPEHALVAKPRWCPECRAPFRTEFARCPNDGTELVQTDEDLLLGQTLGAQYVLDALLGEGAMSRVYRAHHAHLPQKQFAIKVMIGELSSALEMRLRFAQEADAASALQHPNVVSVIDFGKTERALMYLAMEYVEGRTLARLIAQEAPLAPPRALELARQIALGLEHAHGHGLVHRDLKPENIIVTADGTPRIVDFGLAITADEEQSTRLTRVGLVVGTPIYAAPEQTHGEPVDRRADLFALGVTLYEMLAGVVPFEGGMVELAKQNASDVLIPIAVRSTARVKPEIEAVVRTLMRRDPANRFQTARDVIDAIDASSVSTMALPEPPPTVARRPWWMFAAAGFAIAAGVTAFVATRAPTAPKAAVKVASPPVVIEPTHPPVVIEPPHPSVAVEPAPKPPVVVAPRPATIPKPIEPKPHAGTAAVAIASPRPEPEVAPQAPPSAPEVVPAPEPPPTTAKPELPVPVKPAPATPAPLLTTASLGIAGIVVHGPLAEGEVRTAIQRGLEPMKACYRTAARAAQKSPRVTARVSVSFDDSRRATNVHVISPAWPAIAPCIATAAEQLRVSVAPDVGTADVTVDIAFTPVAP